jgi:hypothetical protein
MATTQGITWRDADNNYIKLEYSTDLDSSPLVYTEVTDLKALTRNPEASPEGDFTHYASTGQELKLGLPRHGSYDGVCNYAPKSTTQAKKILDLSASKEELWWRVTYPKVTSSSTQRATEKFRGYVSTAAIAPPAATTADPVDFNFTLRVAGDYSLTAES